MHLLELFLSSLFWPHKCMCKGHLLPSSSGLLLWLISGHSHAWCKLFRWWCSVFLLFTVVVWWSALLLVFLWLRGFFYSGDLVLTFFLVPLFHFGFFPPIFSSRLGCPFSNGRCETYCRKSQVFWLGAALWREVFSLSSQREGPRLYKIPISGWKYFFLATVHFQG